MVSWTWIDVGIKHHLWYANVICDSQTIPWCTYTDIFNRNASYPTVDALTIAHQNPSHTPINTGFGKSEWFVQWSWKEKSVMVVWFLTSDSFTISNSVSGREVVNPTMWRVSFETMIENSSICIWEREREREREWVGEREGVGKEIDLPTDYGHRRFCTTGMNCLGFHDNHLRWYLRYSPKWGNQ